MHRDISVANLLMVPDPKSTDKEITMNGLLIDWDLAKFRDKLEKGSKDTRSVSFPYLGRSFK